MPINIALLSTAHIHTKGFLENLKKGADGRVAYAIWDDVPERGQRYATEFGAKFVANLDDLLKDANVHGFLVCAENTRHIALLEKALPTGKPVFCEKPLATTGADALRAKALAEKSHSTLFCGYFQPFGGGMRAIAKKIADGDFGNITHVRFRNAHHAAYGKWFDSPDLAWFANKELSGGGALLDLGTHAVHLLRHLFGPVAKVQAIVTNRSGTYSTVDDFGMAWLHFANGIIGTVEANWIQQGGPGGLEIMGTKLGLWSEGGAYVVGKPGEAAQPIIDIDGQPATVDRLIAAIQGKLSAQDLAKDVDCCVDAVTIMEAIYAAAQTGGTVAVQKVAKA